MILMTTRDPNGDIRGTLYLVDPPRVFRGRIGDFVMNFKIPPDARIWIGDVFRWVRDKARGGEQMIFPSLEIRTRQDTGKLHGDLVFGDRTFHGIAGSLVDFVTTMATNPHLPKEIQEWIGDTFWAENEKLKTQAGSLVDERDRLEVETTSLKASSERQVNQILDLQAQITKLKTENGRLIGQLSVYIRENEELERRAKTPLLKEISGLQDQIEQQIEQQDETIRQNKALQDELAKLRQQNVASGHCISMFEEDNKGLTDQIQDLKDQIEQQAETIHRHEHLNKALQDDLAGCRQHAASSSRSIFAFKGRIGSLLDERDRLEVENEKLRAQVEEINGLTDQIHNQHKEIQDLKDRIANLQDEEIDSDTLIRDLEIKISEANKQILSLETDNAALRTKLERVEITPLEEAHRTIDLLLDRIFDR